MPGARNQTHNNNNDDDDDDDDGDEEVLLGGRRLSTMPSRRTFTTSPGAPTATSSVPVEKKKLYDVCYELVVFLVLIGVLLYLLGVVLAFTVFNDPRVLVNNAQCLLQVPREELVGDRRFDGLAVAVLLHGGVSDRALPGGRARCLHATTLRAFERRKVLSLYGEYAPLQVSMLPGVPTEINGGTIERRQAALAFMELWDSWPNAAQGYLILTRDNLAIDVEALASMMEAAAVRDEPLVAWWAPPAAAASRAAAAVFINGRAAAALADNMLYMTCLGAHEDAVRDGGPFTGVVGDAPFTAVDYVERCVGEYLSVPVYNSVGVRYRPAMRPTDEWAYSFDRGQATDMSLAGATDTMRDLWTPHGRPVLVQTAASVTDNTDPTGVQSLVQVHNELNQQRVQCEAAVEIATR